MSHIHHHDAEISYDSARTLDFVNRMVQKIGREKGIRVSTLSSLPAGYQGMTGHCVIANAISKALGPGFRPSVGGSIQVTDPEGRTVFNESCPEYAQNLWNRFDDGGDRARNLSRSSGEGAPWIPQSEDIQHGKYNPHAHD